MPAAGLCDSCRHQRVVRNTRGSVFSLCERSRHDDRFPRYPRVPVVSCRGYERAEPEAPRLSVRVGISHNPFGDGSEDVLAFAERAERLGYDSLWLTDAGALGSHAPLPALAAVAARTERLKLGIGVLALPARNPVMLARELATVDVLSHGRLLPAGGLGIEDPVEMEATGVARNERGARLEEHVALLRALWSGEPVTYEGRFWRTSGVRLVPRPHNPKLELWLGGRAPAALRRIGRIADGWLGSFVGPEELGRMVDTIRAAAAEAGRTIDEDHYGTTVFTTPSEEELPAAAQRLLALRRSVPREDHVAFGAEELRSLLWRFREQGATKFVVSPFARDLPDWMERMREVIAPFETEA